MAKRISQLNQITASQLAAGDLIPVVDVSAGQTKYATLQDLTGLPTAGYTATGESWAYASATTITVPTDATIKYQKGNFIRISQTTGGTKYGVISNVASTTLTIYWLGGATLANEAINSPVYSSAATPLGAGGVTGAGINWSATGANGGIWWEELGRTVLTVAGDTISVTGLPARKHLQVKMIALPSGNIVPHLRLNNDSGTNYNYRYLLNESTAAGSVSTSTFPLDSSSTASVQYATVNILNILAYEKMINAMITGQNGAGAGSQATVLSIDGKWANTAAAVNRVDVFNNAGAGDFAIGSEVVVLGHD